MSEDTRVLELDKYERTVVIDALNDMRSDLIKADKSIDLVNELLLKTLDAPEKKLKRKGRCRCEAR